MLQQRRSHVSVPLPCCQVQRRVSGARGGVWARSILQQLLDDVLFAETAGDVQRSLVILETDGKRSSVGGDNTLRERVCLDTHTHTTPPEPHSVSISISYYLGFGVDSCSILDEISNHVGLPRPRRHVERRLPPLE